MKKEKRQRKSKKENGFRVEADMVNEKGNRKSYEILMQQGRYQI